MRILDSLPIVPKHKLGAALAAGTLQQAWGPATPPADLAGMGPFVLREYAPGQRLVRDKLGGDRVLNGNCPAVLIPRHNCMPTSAAEHHPVVFTSGGATAVKSQADGNQPIADINR